MADTPSQATEVHVAAGIEVAQEVKKLGQIFPQVVRDGQVDFDALKAWLSEHGSLAHSDEKYGLGWAGKSDAIQAIRRAATGTLSPDNERSQNWDTTANVFIEGDNLETLKLLLRRYAGKVRMIYLDPPYNTGKDFVYKDNFHEGVSDYYLRTGQDKQGANYSTNSSTSGRYHSNWLNMMYPRLFYAKQLLTDDGAIFVSIDDNEVHNLRHIMDELFGEENFIAQFIHKNNSSKNQAKLVGVSTEYCLCYAKQKEQLADSEWKVQKKGARDIAKLFTELKAQGLSLDEIETEIKDMYKRPKYAHLSRWNKVDGDGVFVDADLSRENGPKDFTITNPETGKPCVIPPRGWGKSEEELLLLQKKGLIYYGDEDTPPRVKQYITDESQSVPDSFWYFDNSVDTRWIKSAFGSLVFQNPKPLEMIKQIIRLYTKADDIIMDFFAGSSTTAHAVLELNAEDGGNRKFVMVQLPEDLDENLAAATDPNEKAVLKNAIAYLDAKKRPHILSELSIERIRFAAAAVADKFASELAKRATSLDSGFKCFRLSQSNYRRWQALDSADENFQQSLLAQATQSLEHPLVDGSRELDVVYEVLLKEGVDLNVPITQRTVDDRLVYEISDTDRKIVVTFSPNVTLDFARGLALNKDDLLVCLDGSLKDADKVNVLQHVKLKTI